jgi:hypothetical protein
MAASVRQRLVNRAHERGDEAELIFVRYCLERLLYRLSVSRHRDVFVLKGAMLFYLWDPTTRRVTRDADLLASGDHGVGRFEAVFRELCDEAVVDDGAVFDADSIRGTVIKRGAPYEGVRVRLVARLGNARVPLQIDIGFGDTITPDPAELPYPTLLGLPAPVLRTYPREAAIAEKFQALVDLGLTNTRIKDFYDLWVLSRGFAYDGSALAAAIDATFNRRGTVLPDGPPPGLTQDFAEQSRTISLWRTFTTRNYSSDVPTELAQVVEDLVSFLMPPTLARRAGERFAMTWPPGGPWQASQPDEV